MNGMTAVHAIMMLQRIHSANIPNSL